MDKWIKKSGTAPVGQMHFRSANLAEAFSENSTATLCLESDKADLDANDFLGKSVCLGFETREGKQRYFDAVVVEMAHESMHGSGRCTYRLQLSSWTWLLGQNREFRVYQHKTVTDIVTELFARHSHPSIRFSDRTTGKKRVWEYLVQFGESDFGFMQRLLELEGIYFYFEHAENRHTLILADSVTVHSASDGYELLQYDPALAGMRLTDEERITRLSSSKTIMPPLHAHSDYNFQNPATSLLTKSAGQVDAFNSTLEVFEYPGRYEQESEGLHYSSMRHEESQSLQQVYEAHTTARGVCTGALLQTTCESNSAFSRSLLVTRTLITLLESEPEANGGVQSSFACQFQAIEAAQPFRPARKTAKPLVSGPLPALVVGPEGREIYTDGFGRIKIQFYWDRYGKRNQDSSCWVRVASPVAGKGFGFFALPRIGQEVVVSFEAGDPDRPLVTGLAFNAAQSVPYPLPEHQTVSGWRSQSTENGSRENFNELRFEDRAGSEYVWFQAEKDLLALIKNHSRTEVGGDVHQLVHGSLVEEIKADVSRTVLGQVSQQIEKALHLSVNDDLLLNVKGLLGLVNQGQIALSTTGQFSVKAGAGIDIQGNNMLNLDAGTQGNFKAGCDLRLSAGSSLSLSVGGSSVLITAAGIVFSGPSISLNGSGGVAPAQSAQPQPPELATAPAAVEPPVDPIH